MPGSPRSTGGGVSNLNPYQAHSITSISLLTVNIQGAASLETKPTGKQWVLNISSLSNAQALTNQHRALAALPTIKPSSPQLLHSRFSFFHRCANITHGVLDRPFPF
jgi:hypothetical protein